MYISDHWSILGGTSGRKNSDGHIQRSTGDRICGEFDIYLRSLIEEQTKRKLLVHITSDWT